MKTLMSAAVASLALASTGSAAAVSDAEFAQLRADFAALAQRLNALEAENQQLRELSESTVSELELTRENLASVEPASSWTDSVKLKGDFRYRYEEIDVEGANTRDRHRIRARAAVVAQLPEDVEVAIGVASGGDDPVSSNQTLGGAGSSKDLKLDLAYFKWEITEGLYLSGGKMKNNFYRPHKTALIWDGDYNPEGAAIGWSNDLLFMTASGTFLESDGNRSNQQLIWGVQGGVNLDLGGASLTTGIGYHDLPTAGNAVYLGDGDEFFGNSFDCADFSNPDTCVYRYDYEELEVFAQLGLNLFDNPVSIYANAVQNLAVDEFDTGWLLGAQYGKVAGVGQWQLGYEYQSKEKDAMFGLLSDSDFAGGGTDGRGHKLYGAYGVTSKWSLAFTWYLNNKAGEDNFGRSVDYDRVMLDSSFKF